jgi:hypothetical protein
MKALRSLLFQPNLIPSLGVLIVLLYFGHFVLPGLHGRFNHDDPMNLYYYWSRGGWALIQGLVLFFTTYYRPMGGVYFYSLYELFGLNPYPYHVVITLLLLVNVSLVYCCARLLSGSRAVGWLCALLASYHARMAHLVYLPAYVFDVICFTFFFSTLVFYLHIRTAKQKLRVWQQVVFLLLYIGALEAKEMAVSLPVILLAYELLWHPPSWSVQGFWEFTKNQALPVLIAALLTLAYILGKTFGPEPLSRAGGYEMSISGMQLIKSHMRFANEIFYNGPDGLLGPVLLVELAFVAWFRKEKHLKWAFPFIVVTPLPIAFFVQGRLGPCLYIPLFGWALALSTLLVRACDALAQKFRLPRLQPNEARLSFLLLVAGLLFLETEHQNNRTSPGIKGSGELAWSLIEHLRSTLPPQVKPGTQIAILNKGVLTDWDLKFITELLYHDRSVTVWLQTKAPLRDAELAKMDYVFTVKEKRLILLKRPIESGPSSQVRQVPVLRSGMLNNSPGLE